MVATDDLQTFPVEQRHPCEELSADERMALHPPHLVGVEWAWLFEDRIGNPDLADVVEEKAVFEAGVVEQARLDGFRQLERVTMDPERVVAGGLVFGL